MKVLSLFCHIYWVFYNCSKQGTPGNRDPGQSPLGSRQTFSSTPLSLFFFSGTACRNRDRHAVLLCAAGPGGRRFGAYVPIIAGPAPGCKAAGRPRREFTNYSILILIWEGLPPAKQRLRCDAGRRQKQPLPGQVGQRLFLFGKGEHGAVCRRPVSWSR